MILESIITTINEDGSANISPMGPLVTGELSDGFELRPFETSRTLANLKARPHGVLHVTDDVLLFARSAIGRLTELPPLSAAEKIAGNIIVDACRWYEFEVTWMDETSQRANLRCKTIHSGRQRDFWGFNRAKHAVLEAAILATRVDFLPAAFIANQFVELEKAVEKTGGEREREAMKLLVDFVGASRDTDAPQ